ncbi:Integrase family protein [Desulfamplus magnetovallimortis]|uniref:Integrase family protein n=1 Tax=Desulfamplus magnetovallimortis TaxID=1246637 RepID=A0A1W1HBG6_9BACT|nr:tyrosine-type recombinase/integrase [Desulfamplus magnetovallimortis]SLM29779.1 Integrase family protein [Desulfamplus magnetovallimortis]
MGAKVREKKKGSGEWWIFINHNGKRKAKKVGKDKRVALEVAKKIEAKIALGDFNDDKEEEQNPLFGEYATMWIGVTVPATCKPSSIGDYNGILKNHMLPEFGKKSVTEITRLIVKNFLMKKINKGFATSTVSHMKNAISGVLNLALDDEVIAVNPAHNVGKIFKKQQAKLTIQPYTQEELKKLLDCLELNHPLYYPMFLTMARTGIRLGECLGLQWKDIDFDDRFINIQRGFSKGKIETPKSGQSRKVDMSLQLTATLKELSHQRKIDTLKNGWKSVPEWVFVKSNGNPFHESYMRRVFYKAIEQAGLRKIRIHDLRHTYATIRISNGDNIADVSKQLGHHSVKFTMDIYYHWVPGGKKNEVDRLDDFDGGATKRNLSATT